MKISLSDDTIFRERNAARLIGKMSKKLNLFSSLAMMSLGVSFSANSRKQKKGILYVDQFYMVRLFANRNSIE